MTASNAPIPLLPAGATPTVVSSIRQAAQATNMDFGLLMAQAKQESGFQPDAKASGSSASGLFQFIASTWLSMVQRFGQKYGLGALAQQISSAGNGHPEVADPAARQQILDLRRDPRLSSAMAAEYARLNQQTLEQSLGRPAASADIYLAHFLGANGALTFLKGLGQSGGTPGADLLPQAAAANPAVFFDPKSGRARSLSEIYQGFAARIGGDAGTLGSTPASTAPAAALAHGLTFDGNQLSSPTAAMLELFANSALQMLGGDGLPSPVLPST